MPTRVDHVIWDVGNVLIRWDAAKLYRQRGMDDAAIAGFFAETDLMAHNIACDAGAHVGESMAELGQRFPHYRGELLAFDAQWTETLNGAIEPSVAQLARLKSVKVPCLAITNFNRVKFDIARKLLPFLDTFDDCLVSADIRLVKPDPRIFKVLLDRHQLDPARALFIDDSDKNIAAAASLGLKTHLFNERTSDLGAVLYEHGL
jgi:2-haloacid dehalogenase